MASFSAQVDAWVSKSQQRLDAVFKQSAIEVIELMQTPVAKGGNMPVDTGFLRSSLQVNLTGPVAADQEGQRGVTFTYSPSVAEIAKAKPGDTIWATYSANYALHVHYGVGGRPGRMWVTLAAQKWPSIVKGVASRLKASVSSGSP